MVGPVVPEHLAPPGQYLIRLIAVGDEAAIPDRQILEGGIQFASQKSLLEMQIPLHRINGGRRIGLVLGVALSHRHRLLQAGAQRQALEDAVLGPRARLLDRHIDLHGPAVLAILGAIRNEHLLHQVNLGKELIHEGFLLFPLLGKLGKTVRGGLGQDRAFHQSRV